MTTAVRPVSPVTPAVRPLPDGGWLLTLPLRVNFGKKGNRATPAVPSKNEAGSGENRHIYAGRRDALKDILATLLAVAQPKRPYLRVRTIRVGIVMAHITECCVFYRADLTLTLYHPTRNILRSDHHNWISGAAALFDAIEISGWVVNDQNLTIAEPVLEVDRHRPRIEVTLRPCVSRGVESDAGERGGAG